VPERCDCCIDEFALLFQLRAVHIDWVVALFDWLGVPKLLVDETGQPNELFSYLLGGGWFSVSWLYLPHCFLFGELLCFILFIVVVVVYIERFNVFEVLLGIGQMGITVSCDDLLVLTVIDTFYLHYFPREFID
jgi:hypothetical protein